MTWGTPVILFGGYGTRLWPLSRAGFPKRSWSWCDTLDTGERFKVKRICVKTGALLSFQKHQHCAEHWIIAKRAALVTRGDKSSTIVKIQLTYIPQGQLHRFGQFGESGSRNYRDVIGSLSGRGRYRSTARSMLPADASAKGIA